ncbi:DNA phosphorothioation-dependent restriction protein DptG [Plebeiibacterium sediminum]|uniref:DNA phosphorothioation-dependent restriction protein DptG n=1 Tax=Plebeiibacterium sediminum TaxID=2992112 RepID=A0AAE3M7B9_9BACT|nr:DNA phosphorothioation-dependent restriction protein DptG [Plebeiobacterium sediminum]MCW3788494.1 DNA phosphorothioation-dependent restriction protein DptG [Plebeiobacterium sediminum]
MVLTFDKNKIKGSFSKSIKDVESDCLIASNNFQHCKGKIIKVFPFATDETGLNASESDFKTFNGVIGNVVRKAFSCPSKNVIVDKDFILNEIGKKDDFIGNEQVKILQDIIEKLLFDKNGDIFKFDLKVLKYLQFEKENAKLKSIAEFVTGTLITNDIQKMIKDVDTPSNEHLLYRLVLDVLQDAEDNNGKYVDSQNGFYEGLLTKNLKEQLKKDIESLSVDENGFIENINQLIKFYFFQLIVQLCLAFDHFIYAKEKRNVPKLFFTFNWEKVNKSRLGIVNGWQLLESHTEDLFVHANCLEFLNTINWKTEGLKTYKEIEVELEELDEEELFTLNTTIQSIIHMYKTNFLEDIQFKEGKTWEDIDKKNFTTLDTTDNKTLVIDSIKELFHTIKFQFKYGKGGTAQKAYSNWFKRFSLVNYLRRRGPLGMALSMDKQLLLLLTSLSIGNKDKILVKHLWEELENKGVYLDLESKKEAIKLFEQIAILEKKSDSGDAQYVKKLTN